MRTNQMIAVRPIRDDEPAAVDHGEAAADRPIPVPKASNASDNAAATKAPANTAAQDTPEECASFRFPTVPDNDDGCSIWSAVLNYPGCKQQSPIGAR